MISNNQGYNLALTINHKNQKKFINKILQIIIKLIFIKIKIKKQKIKIKKQKIKTEKKKKD